MDSQYKGQNEGFLVITYSNSCCRLFFVVKLCCCNISELKDMSGVGHESLIRRPCIRWFVRCKVFGPLQRQLEGYGKNLRAEDKQGNNMGKV